MVNHALLVVAVVGALASGCGARPGAARTATGDELTLYRDRALVTRRVELAMTAPGSTTISVKLAAGLAPADLEILEHGDLVIAGRRPAGAAPATATATADPADPADDPIDPDDRPDATAVSQAPLEVELVVEAPRAGRFTLVLGYTTPRLRWSAAYTMTTTAARDRASLGGAIAVRNSTGLALRGRGYLVDAELGSGRDHTAEVLGTTLADARDRADSGTAVYELGVVSLGDGETRIALLAGTAPRRMRSVLVYDPIGVRLDHAGAVPLFEPTLGIKPAAATRVSESFEVDRDDRVPLGLPAAPVRLLERRADGALAVLGDGRLFELATRGAVTDTVAIGTADGITGHRERRDWANLEGMRRLSEEFLITLDNARSRPVEVVVREHLYRGQNWTLAYHSVPAVKEGPQQIALRVTVPPGGQAKVLYVVVYTW